MKNRGGKNNKISRGVWKVIETEVKKTGMVKAEKEKKRKEERKKKKLKKEKTMKVNKIIEE